MDIDFTQLKMAFDMFRSAISLAKDAKDLLPDSDQKTTMIDSLNAASNATALAEAQIAKALDYNLCQCTFPPSIMLSIGFQEESYRVVEKFQCPSCKKIYPPKQPPLPKTRVQRI